MPSASYGVSLQAGGVAIQKSIVRTGDHPNAYEVTLPVAWPITSWVKTDADTAAGNLASGHGQTNGNYDIYWPGGARYGVAVTITTNACAFEGGLGTDFPASATAGVVICKQVVVNTAIDGDAVQIIGLSLEYADPSTATTVIGNAEFFDVDDASVVAVPMTANSPVVCDVVGGADNIMTGTPITYALASHNNTAAAATLKIVSLEDSTP